MQKYRPILISNIFCRAQHSIAEPKPLYNRQEKQICPKYEKPVEDGGKADSCIHSNMVKSGKISNNHTKRPEISEQPLIPSCKKPFLVLSYHEVRITIL